MLLQLIEAFQIEQTANLHPQHPLLSELCGVCELRSEARVRGESRARLAWAGRRRIISTFCVGYRLRYPLTSLLLKYTAFRNIFRLLRLHVGVSLNASKPPLFLSFATAPYSFSMFSTSSTYNSAKRCKRCTSDGPLWTSRFGLPSDARGSAPSPHAKRTNRDLPTAHHPPGPSRDRPSAFPRRCTGPPSSRPSRRAARLPARHNVQPTANATPLLAPATLPPAARLSHRRASHGRVGVERQRVASGLRRVGRRDGRAPLAHVGGRSLRPLRSLCDALCDEQAMNLHKLGMVRFRLVAKGRGWIDPLVSKKAAVPGRDLADVDGGPGLTLSRLCYRQRPDRRRGSESTPCAGRTGTTSRASRQQTGLAIWRAMTVQEI